MKTIMKGNFRKRVFILLFLIVFITVSINISTGTPAYAQTREERLEEWFNDAKIGLMLCWGMNTGGNYPAASPIYSTASQFEQAAASANWSADKWVDAAKEMHAKYIVICSLHSLMGYLKIWPSQVPGTPCTTTDYLGQLIDAADDEGIKVIAYITSDPSHHYEYGTEWMDKAAYRAYKSDPYIDITTSSGFAQYTYDVIDELITNYPDLAGFWFDGWCPGWDTIGLFSHIHSRNDSLINIRNNFGSSPADNEDVMAVEDYGKVFDPYYDYPNSGWLGPNGGVEATFTANNQMCWWDMGFSTTVDFKKVIGRIATSTGTGWNAMIGELPGIGGDLTSVDDSLNSQIDDFMDWADESIFDTVGGGYQYGGFQPGWWSASAYGTTTMQKDNYNIHYLHVLEPPQGCTKLWSGTSWNDSGLDGLDTGARSITKDTSGNIWLCNYDYEIWRYDGSTWTQMPGTAQEIDAGSDGSVWKIAEPDNSGSGCGLLAVWNGTSWNETAGGGKHLAVDTSGNVWLTNHLYSIYKYNGTFQQMPGLAQDIATGSDGSVWKIREPDNTGSGCGLLSKWNGSSWDDKAGGGLRVDVDCNGHAWLVNHLNQIYRYDGSTFIIQPGSGLDVAVGTDGSLWKFDVHGDTLILPDCGYKITQATNLETSESLQYSQADGELCITVPEWGAVDTVIKLTTEGPYNVIPYSSLSVSATTQDAYHPASYMIDGLYDTYYSPSSAASLPQEIVINLGSEYNVFGLEITQPEDCPVTSGGAMAPPPTRIKDYEIYTSDDGVNWGSAIQTGTMNNQRGLQVISFNAEQKQYIKLKVLNNVNSSDVLKISTLNVYGSKYSGYWDLNDGSGNSAMDRSYNCNNGTIYGASWVSDASRDGLSFDGVNDYVSLGNPSSLDITGEITIAAWVKPQIGAGANQDIISRGYSTSPAGAVFLRINTSYGPRYQVGSWDGNNAFAEYSIPAGDIGNWVHLAGVYDGTQWKLYRNGSLVSTVTSNQGAVPVGDGWAIGSRSTGTERFYQGVVDDVFISNRDLSDAEIMSLYLQN